jgi:hypothetical protein
MADHARAALGCLLRLDSLACNHEPTAARPASAIWRLVPAHRGNGLNAESGLKRS